MKDHRDPPGEGAPNDSEVRLQLERILSNPIFIRSERLSAFLRFVTERMLDGRGSTLKEQLLGIELYGKGPEFEGAADPIVRVDARRLRDKLREYYAESPHDPILISLPKGAYVPVFVENRIAAVPHAPFPVSRDRVKIAGSTRWIGATVAMSLVLLIGAVLTSSSLRKAARAPHLVSITPFQSNKQAPALSPDGRFVAFSSRGPENSGGADIWVKAVDSEALRRLTATPQFTETSPAWSPDGREIAFIRAGEGVFIVPASGGTERKVSESGIWTAWAPDGKSILIRDREGDAPFAIYQISLDGRKRHRLTEPRLADGDWRFSVSPDGSSLAVVRYEAGLGDIHIVPMKGGDSRRVTNWGGTLEGVVWTPDGRELIYSKHDGLWRISAGLAQAGRGSRIQGVSVHATNLSISRPGPGQAARLVFQAPDRDLSFRMIDLTAPLHEGVIQAVKPFPASTHLEYPGPFSPDGRHFAFVSGRPPQLWISGADGTGLRQITSANVTELSAGSWSPDGRRIVYHASVNGNTDIFVVDAAGGVPKRLTFETSMDSTASWSRDGRWIYFSSNRGGTTPDIWRMPADGGPAVRITDRGGLRPQESFDGKYLYYADRMPPAELTRPTGTARLMRVAVGGGAETVALEGITPLWWSIAQTGIFFICREGNVDFIDHYAFADGTVARIGRLATQAGAHGGQMSVSPDGRRALVTAHRVQSELMLLDGFK